MDEPRTDLQRFGRIVRERREELGLQQEEMKDRGGPSSTTMSQIERGVGKPPTRLVLDRLDRGLGWASGSAKRTLAGGEPSVTGVIRNRDGKALSRWDSNAGAEQDDLEICRLAYVVMDARDLVRTQKGPLNAAITALLDEAVELQVRRVARSRSGDISEEALADAHWFLDQTRYSNGIRRQGDIYVADDDVLRIDVTWPPKDGPVASESSDGATDWSGAAADASAAGSAVESPGAELDAAFDESGQERKKA